MEERIIVYLLDYKTEEANIYSYAYIDFRTLKDLRLFNQLTELNLMTETVISLVNLHANKRLRRGAYYQLNLHLLQDKNVEGHVVTDDLAIGYNYDFSHTQWRGNEFLLDTHEPLDREDVMFVNNATNNIFSGLANGIKEPILRVNNVGQGNCNEILDGECVKLVYDIGATMTMKKADVIALKNKRIGAYKSDRPLLVISHWDLDHFIQLKEMSDQELACFSGLLCSAMQPSCSSQTIYGRIKKTIGKANVNSVKICPTRNHNDQMYFYQKANAFSFYYGKKATSKNYAGFTVFMQGNDCNVLLTGDCNYVQISNVLNKGMLNPGQVGNLVMVVPHHGGTFSSKFNILSIPRAFTAEEAIISVDAMNNNYGHPSKTTIKMLQNWFAQINRTDVIGDIERYL